MMHQPMEKAEIEGWLSPGNPSVNAYEAKIDRHLGTGRWFLDGNEFSQWKLGSRQHLWLYGMPGCGKTILSATILDHLTQMDDRVILFFFFDFRDTSKQKLNDLLRSLAFQLYSSHPESRKYLSDLFTSCDNGGSQPDNDQLSMCLIDMMRAPRKVCILIDALDECSEIERLLSWMQCSISTLAHVQVVATSCPANDLTQNLPSWVEKENCLPLNKESINADIRSYIEARLEADEDFKRWAFPEVIKLVSDTVSTTANERFRWAACQLDILLECHNIAALQAALQSLPRDLNATYGQILENMPSRLKEKTTRILQFLVYSERPLAVNVAVHIMAVDLGEQTFDVTNTVRCLEEIRAFNHRLISLAPASVTQTTSVLQLAHFSVKEYLLGLDTADFTSPGPMEAITDVCLTYLGGIQGDIYRKFPLAEYAAQIWMDHAKIAEKKKFILEKIIEFLLSKSKFRLWLSLFNPDENGFNRLQPYNFASNNRGFRGSLEAPPLYYACLMGLEETAHHLIMKDEPVNARGGYHGSALAAASSNGHLEVVRLLLENGADINAGCLATVPLEGASLGGHLEIVQLLLNKGADINENGWSGSAIEAASSGGHLEIVKLLLDNGADVHNGKINNIALAAASSYGHLEIVKLLLDSGAVVDTGSIDNIALTAASSNGHLETVRLLLKNGANVNSGRFGSFALEGAEAEGHLEIVQLLVDNGAKINPNRILLAFQNHAAMAGI